ncbi:unnamed protein product [Closterium sp. NIES-65]|nr:unnamed protein product [Closterium sp. NIES-65]
MEWASPPVPLPLLANPKAYAAVLALRCESDNPAHLTEKESALISSFRERIPLWRQQAESDASVDNATERAAKFEDRLASMLDDFDNDPESHGGPPDVMVSGAVWWYAVVVCGGMWCCLLYRLRDICLRELGFEDIYRHAKGESTSMALQQLLAVLAAVDDISNHVTRSEALIRGMLAGNLAALDGADPSVGTADFLSVSDSLPAKPWAADDMGAAVQTWSNQGEGKWSKAVVLCAGAGRETVLGLLPAVRDLTRRGVKVGGDGCEWVGVSVLLVVPDMPSGAAITHEDLMNLLKQVQAAAPEDDISMAISNGRILVLNSGSDLQALDLSAVSPELAYAASDADVIILTRMPPQRSSRGKGKEKVSDDEKTPDPPYVAWMKEQQKQGKPSPSIKRMAKAVRETAGASSSRSSRHDYPDTGADTDVSDDDLEEIVSESDSDADSADYKRGTEEDEEDTDGGDDGSGDERSTRPSKKEHRAPSSRNKRVWSDAELTSLAAARWNTKDDLKAMQGKQGSQYWRKLRAHMLEKDKNWDRDEGQMSNA